MTMLTKIWKRQPGPFFCISIKDEVSWRDRFFTRSQFADLDQFIEEHEDDEVYWCPHSFIHKARRKDYYASPSNMLWADLDAVDPRTLDLPPTYAWETSPKRYAAIWRLDDEPTEDLRRTFNDAIGADAGWHVTKVMRVPGTRNHKYHKAPRGRALWEGGATYKLSAIMRKYPPDKQIPPVDAKRFDTNGDPKAICQKLNAMGILQDIRSQGPFPDRSKLYFKIAIELAEKGATASEVATCVATSNCYRDKCKELGSRWGREELERVVSKVMARV